MENFDSTSGVIDYVTNSSAWHNRSPPIAVAQAFTLLSTKNFDPTIVKQSCGKGVAMREKDLEERGASMELSNAPKTHDFIAGSSSLRSSDSATLCSCAGEGSRYYRT